MTRHRPYPSDLSDARWELLGPTLTAWRAERRGKGLDIGRPPEHDLRRIVFTDSQVDRMGSELWRFVAGMSVTCPSICSSRLADAELEVCRGG